MVTINSLLENLTEYQVGKILKDSGQFTRFDQFGYCKNLGGGKYQITGMVENIDFDNRVDNSYDEVLEVAIRYVPGTDKLNVISFYIK